MNKLGIGKRIFLTLGILSCCFQFSFSQTPEEEKIDPYENNLNLFHELMYILTADWVDGQEEIWNTYIESLQEKGLNFKITDSRKLRRAYKYINLGSGFSLKHYQSPSKNEWMYFIRHEEPDSILNLAKRIPKFRTWGGNTNRSPYKSFAYSITYETGNELGSLNVILRRENQILVMGKGLSFPVEAFDDLNRNQRIEVRAGYQEIQTMIDEFSNHFVDPNDWLKKPLHGERLSSTQRLYGFTQFWTEVKYNFAFFDQVPELDWENVLYEYLPIIEEDQSNAQYYQTLKLICAKLGDGHTNIYPPQGINGNLDWPGLELKNFDQKAFVTNTKEEYAERIPLGSEIVEVDGIPTDEFLKTSVFPYISSSTKHILYDWGIRDILDGEKGSEVKLKIRTRNGQTETVKMIRDRKIGGNWIRKGNPRGGLITYKQLEDDIAYVSLNSFGNKEIIEEFKKRVDSIKSCKGIIIDLRKNGGGNSSIGYAILNHFTNKSYRGSASRTRNHMASHKAWGKFVDKDTPLEELSEFDQISRLTAEGDYWHEFEVSKITPDVKSIIKLPLVVLIGHNTASAAEDFLVALDQVGIAKVIGSPSFGSTGQPLMMDMPGGGRARICTKRDTYPDGREFVGYGIQPDFKVAQSVEDYLVDKDVVLEYAIKYMKEHPEYSSDKK